MQYSASPGLFRTLRVPIIAGRDFSETDRIDAPPVVIVDRSLIARHWEPAQAIGKRIRMAGDTAWRTIVGVVDNIRDESVADSPRPHTYFPYAQYGGSRPTLVVRSEGDPAATLNTVKHLVAQVDAGVPIDNPHAITAAIATSLATQRLMELLLSGFAVLAMLLAACGLYGVMSLYVAARQREFGIRAAIGARPAELVRAVVSEGLMVVALGGVTGLLASFAAGSALRSLLYEVAPTDAVVYVGVALMLAVVAVTACYVPARGAARSDPLVALRQE